MSLLHLFLGLMFTAAIIILYACIFVGAASDRTRDDLYRRQRDEENMNRIVNEAKKILDQ